MPRQTRETPTGTPSPTGLGGGVGLQANQAEFIIATPQVSNAERAAAVLLRGAQVAATGLAVVNQSIENRRIEQAQIAAQDEKALRQMQENEKQQYEAAAADADLAFAQTGDLAAHHRFYEDAAQAYTTDSIRTTAKEKLASLTTSARAAADKKNLDNYKEADAKIKLAQAQYPESANLIESLRQLHLNASDQTVRTAALNDHATFIESQNRTAVALEAARRASVEKGVTALSGIAKTNLLSADGPDYSLVANASSTPEVAEIVERWMVGQAAQLNLGIPLTESGQPEDPATLQAIKVEAGQRALEWAKVRHKQQVDGLKATFLESVTTVANRPGVPLDERIGDIAAMANSPVYDYTEEGVREAQNLLSSGITSGLTSLRSSVLDGTVSYRDAIKQAVAAEKKLQASGFGTTFAPKFEAFAKDLPNVIQETLTREAKSKYSGRGDVSRGLFTPATKNGVKPIDVFLVRKMQALGIEIPQGTKQVADVPPPADPILQPAYDAMVKIRSQIESEAKDQGYAEGKWGTPADYVDMMRNGAIVPDSSNLDNAYEAMSLRAVLTPQHPDSEPLLVEVGSRLGVTSDQVRKTLANGTDIEKISVFKTAAAIDKKTLGPNGVPDKMFADVVSGIESNDHSQVLFSASVLSELGGTGSAAVTAKINDYFKSPDQKAAFIAKSAILHSLWNGGDMDSTWQDTYTSMSKVIDSTDVRRDANKSKDQVQVQGKYTHEFFQGKLSTQGHIFQYLTENKLSPELGKKTTFTAPAEFTTAVDMLAFGFRERMPNISQEAAYASALGVLATDGYRFNTVTHADGSQHVTPIYDPNGHYLPEQEVDAKIRHEMDQVIPTNTEMETQLRDFFGIDKGMSTNGWKLWDYVQANAPVPRDLEEVRFSMDYLGNGAAKFMALADPTYAYEKIPSGTLSDTAGFGPLPPTHNPRFSLETTWLSGGGAVLMSAKDQDSTLQNVAITANSNPNAVFTYSSKRLPFVNPAPPIKGGFIKPRSRSEIRRSIADLEFKLGRTLTPEERTQMTTTP